jgi:putative sterol carrier protein
MASESGDVGQQSPTLGGVAPGLAGVHGRLRIEVAGNPVGTLVVEGTHVEFSPDTTGSVDATVVVASDDAFRKLLKGELNPFIASMRGLALLRGDRNLGTKVILGLQAGSPFAAVAVTAAQKGA